MPHLSLVGMGSCIWDTLKKGTQLIKDGVSWICNKVSEALFRQDSWDGHPPILSTYLQLQPLCNSFTDVGWVKVENFKMNMRIGQVEVTCWKDPLEGPLGGSDEDRVVLVNILEGRLCSSLKERYILAWGPNPKGKFFVAEGYAQLDRQLYGLTDVP